MMWPMSVLNSELDMHEKMETRSILWLNYFDVSAIMRDGGVTWDTNTVLL